MRKAARKNESEDYRSIRAKLLTHGMSLRSFALMNGYSVQTVYDAAKGRRSGPVTIMVLGKLLEAANGKA